MPSLKLFLYLTCLLMETMAEKTDLLSHSSVRQVRSLESIRIGDNVILPCFYQEAESSWLFWYKQTLGQKPTLICSFYVYSSKITFYDEFDNNPRFRLHTTKGAMNLTVSNVSVSDSATYYCANRYSFVLRFAEGTIVNVKAPDLNIPALVHQSASESIDPGDSVSLNCTVHTGTCNGEHSVYWFRDDGESHPGIIYTHGDRNDQCERKPDAQTRKCVYNVQIEHLNHSHAGTYYCAVASCGHVLFGKGTKLEFDKQKDFPVWVYVLSGAAALTSILCVLLSFIVFKMNKATCCKCSESQTTRAGPSTTNAGSYQNPDNLHYAALNVNQPNRSRRQRNDTKSECVYSAVTTN